jgi:hypothetical protein
MSLLFAIELLIADSEAADGAGFSVIRAGSKKQISIILIPSAVRFDWS